ncbi:tRNA (guanine(37)-N1)-methyltransferase [Tetrabaena socialis]|uniref:tRNA (Guanine(37)-N1)-methyltransferase n=1 Tax=Tetrabaena socialis TaxID=47790 RepID=A0A2J7ZYX4_9CHLO|nr:tRNA (guanine(37)-N1)-methyltransferase [Tetrabaena socialis]|eukprot:PNH05470.1 tRNA (guanine(37)-N1)-methyltransferase [Tetrabaena socialis]
MSTGHEHPDFGAPKASRSETATWLRRGDSSGNRRACASLLNVAGHDRAQEPGPGASEMRKTERATSRSTTPCWPSTADRSRYGPKAGSQESLAVSAGGSGSGSGSAACPAALPTRPSSSVAATAMEPAAAAQLTAPQAPLAAGDPPGTAEAAAAAAERASSSGREGTGTATGTGEVPSLDRDSFKQTLNVVALRIPSRRCTDMMKAFKGFMLDRPRLRCIVPDGAASATKLLLLDEGVTLEGLTPELRSLVEAEGLAQLPHAVVLDYSMLPADAVLKVRYGRRGL